MRVVAGKTAQFLHFLKKMVLEIPWLGVVSQAVTVGAAFAVDDDLLQRRDADVGIGDQRDAILDRTATGSASASEPSS